MVADKNTKPLTGRNAVAEQMWFAPNPKLRTQAARERAIEVVELIRTQQSEALNEQDLFIVFHTCAFYANGADHSPSLSEAERVEWVERWQDVREHIVESNLGLVYTTLGRFRSQAIDDDQMLSEALLALSHGVRRFDPWKGFKFSTYACNCIARACIRRNKRDYDHQQRFGVSYDSSFDKPSEEADTDKLLRIERMRHVLVENEGELSDIERRVLGHRFPLDNSARLTFRDIGKTVGLSKERVRQIQNVALRKLRDVLEGDPALK